MKKLMEIIKENTVVSLATVEDCKPRVRPVQMCLIDEGKLWFSTAKNKDMYKQMQAEPMVEFAVTTPDFRLLRVRAEVKFSDDFEIKQKIFESSAVIKGIYLSADNPVFSLFYIDHGEARYWDFSGEAPTLEKF